MNLEVINNAYQAYCINPLHNPLNIYFNTIKYTDDISEAELNIRKLKEICIRVLYDTVFLKAYFETKSEVDSETSLLVDEKIQIITKDLDIINCYNGSIDNSVLNCLLVQIANSDTEHLTLNELISLNEIKAVFLLNYAVPIITAIFKCKNKLDLSVEDFVANHRLMWEISLIAKHMVEDINHLIEQQSYLMENDDYVKELTPRQRNQINNLINKSSSLGLYLPQTFNAINMLKEEYMVKDKVNYDRDTIKIYNNIINLFIPQLTNTMFTIIQNFKL